MIIEISNPEKPNILKYIRNLFSLEKKKLKQLKIEYYETLRFFLSIKKKKIIIN